MKKLAFLFFLPLLVACGEDSKPSQTNPETEKKSETMDTSTESTFPFDECTALVIYAGNSEDDEPSGSFPSLVLEEYDSDANFLMVDNAPLLSVLCEGDMEENLEGIATNNEKDAAQLERIKGWVTEKSSEGYSCFLYELEPPSMAGDAYKAAVAAEEE